jgi:hypothetical protein
MYIVTFTRIIYMINYIRSTKSISFILRVIIYFFTIAYSFISIAQTVPKKEINDSQSMSKTTKKNVDPHVIVEALANKNTPPRLIDDNYHFPIFDDKYDWTEYNRVWDAIKVVIKNEEEAWPELVSHLEDERYCITYESMSGRNSNRSIGDMCRIIIGRNLSEAYFQKMQPGLEIIAARFQLPEIVRDKHVLKTWCEERKNKKLYELQNEMCVWIINELLTPDNLPDSITVYYAPKWIADIESEMKILDENKLPVLFPGFGSEELVRYNKTRAENIRQRYLKE